MTNEEKSLAVLKEAKVQIIREISMAGPNRAQSYAPILVNIDNAIKVLEPKLGTELGAAPPKKMGRPAKVE